LQYHIHQAAHGLPRMQQQATTQTAVMPLVKALNAVSCHKHVMQTVFHYQKAMRQLYDRLSAALLG